MGIKCKCGAMNPDNARFCYNDGRPLDSATRPTRLRLGSGSASDEQELINLIDQNWDEAREHLYSGRLATSLSNMGWLDAAAKAEQIRKNVPNKDEGLENFAEEVGASAPQLCVSPSSLDYGRIEQGKSKTLGIKIGNTTRGYLVGTISCTAPGVSLSVTEFEFLYGDSVAIHATVNTRSLQGQKQYRKDLIIQSNGGDETLALAYYVSAPIGQVLEPTGLFAIFGALLMLVIRAIPASIDPVFRDWIVGLPFDHLLDQGLGAGFYFAILTISVIGLSAYWWKEYK